VIVRYVQTCNEKLPPSKGTKDLVFEFAVDHYIWTFFKLMITFILMIVIFSMRANPKLEAHKKPFWCLIITLLATFVSDILTIVIQ